MKRVKAMTQNTANMRCRASRPGIPTLRVGTSIRRLATLLLSLLLLGTVIFPNSPTHAADAPQTIPPAPQIPAHLHDADVAQRWIDLLYERVSLVGIYPPTAARVYGYTSVALYEAVAAGTPTLDSLGGRLNELPALPQPDPALVYDWPSVANAAVATVSTPILAESPVSTLFISTESERVARHVDALQREIHAERLAEVDANVVTQSERLGKAIGQAILAWAAADGFAETRSLGFDVPTSGEAYWSPIRNLDPIEPYWHTLRPMVMTDNFECAVPLAVEFSTEIDSPFYWQAMEIYHTSIKLTEEHEDIADFWDDQAGEAGMHPGHWLLIANQLVEQQNLNLAEAADVLVRAGLAVHEAGLSAWTMKYHENVLRPEIYIQRYIDPTWEPFLDTPNFPEYPSGHATFGAATAEVLTERLGVIAFTDNGGVVDDMGRARAFTSLEAAAYENGLSRLYGGIHYRMGMEAGLRQGECIGELITERLESERP